MKELFKERNIKMYRLSAYDLLSAHLSLCFITKYAISACW